MKSTVLMLLLLVALGIAAARPSGALQPKSAAKSGGVSGSSAAAPVAPPSGTSEERVAIWAKLANVRIVEKNKLSEPVFDAAIMALNARDVEISGFILPLEQGEKQQHFLISAYPQTCPFCSPFGPEGLVEVFSRTPIQLTFRAITLKGRFQLSGNYAETGLFYRIVEAGLATEY